MRKIHFYRTENGDSPIIEFLDSLSSKQAQKVTWVLRLIEDMDVIPVQYFKKLKNTENNIFRLLGFLDGEYLIVLNHGFQKKTQKTPKKDIELAEQRKRDYLHRRSLS